MELEMTWQPSLLQRIRKSGHRPPLGLRNLGNSCYLNSVLQCLTYTPPLANLCIRNLHSSLCEKKYQQLHDDKNIKNGTNISSNGSAKKHCPFCLLEKRIVRSLSLDATSDAPSKIQSCLRLFADHFQWGRQEDAHEFLRYVIDACHNTCLKLLKSSPAQPPSPASRTVVKDIFGGALLSQVKCLSCGAESNKTDEIMDISLDLFQSSSLRDALRRFFQLEVLDGDNKYSCSSCKKLSAAKKQLFILKAPNVLVIQLKRFEGMHGGKINKDIAFEEDLVLSSFMSKASQDPQPGYNLFGCIVHSGYSPDSGHYYSYIKDPSGRWYCCNDAYVSLSTAQTVLSEKVYILFFLRCSLRPEPDKTDLPCSGKKSTESNGSSLHGRKSATQLRPPPARPNGLSHTEKEASLMPKTDQVALSPQIKFNLKNSENKDPLKQENGHLCINDKSLNGKMNSNVNKTIPSAEKAKMVQTSSPSEKLLVADDCNGFRPSKMADLAPKSSLTSSEPNTSLNHVVDNKSPISADLKERNNSKVANTIVNGSRRSALLTSGPDCHSTPRGLTDRSNYDTLGDKRKSSSFENHDTSCFPNSKSIRTSWPATSCKEMNIISGKYSHEEFVKLKTALYEEAYQELQSCGWVNEVENFMRAQKRLRSEVARDPPNPVELRKVFVADAKKIFVSQIPEVLKARLVESLRSFCEGSV